MKNISYEIIEKEALIAALLDPRKKKMKFADENEKEFAKTSLYEVYELAKNDANIQQKREKYQRHMFIKEVCSQMMNLTIPKLMTMKLKDT